MADDRAHQTGLDSKFINTQEDYDIIYWSTILKVSRAQLLAAIEQVGNSVAAVKRHLGNQR